MHLQSNESPVPEQWVPGAKGSHGGQSMKCPARGSGRGTWRGRGREGGKEPASKPAALLAFERWRQPQHLIGEIGRVIAEQKSAEVENQFSQRDLVRQQNAGVSPTGFIPGVSQSQEVPGVMCEQSAVFMGRKRELEFVRGTQVSRFASDETIHAVLARTGASATDTDSSR